MKKIISIAFAAILAGFAISCQKEEAVSDKADAVQYTFNITVNDRVGFDSEVSTKGAAAPTYKSAWENGDKIFLFFKPTSGSLLTDTYATLTYNGNSWNGAKTGTTSLGNGGTLSAVYVYKLDGSVTPAYSDSKWTIPTGNTFYNCQTGVTYTVSGSEISASLNLVAPADFVCFSIYDTSGDALTCNNVKGWKDVVIGSEMTFSNATCTGYMTGFDNIGETNYKDYYGRIVGGGTSLNGLTCNFSVVNDGKVYERTATPSSDKKSFYMDRKKNWTEAAGKLPGLFTVDKGADGTAGTADDVQVRFSKGNLYASRTSSTSNDWSWGFYDKQYQFHSSSMPEISTSGGSRTAAEGDTEIDLFTWGYDNTSTKGSYSLNPVNTSGITGHNSDGNQFDTNEDWGSISGLPSAPYSGGWRTLTKDEWVYLLNTRTSSTVNGTANARYLKCKVNDGTRDVYGLLIFPDTFTWPTTVTAPGASDINKKNLAWNLVPGYNQTQFEALEGAGAVFLPAAGLRGGSNVADVGGSGTYWSSTASGSGSACRVYFYSYDVYPDISDARYYGFSVRLITESN